MGKTRTALLLNVCGIGIIELRNVANVQTPERYRYAALNNMDGCWSGNRYAWKA
jgi:hypothetical protein